MTPTYATPSAATGAVSSPVPLRSGHWLRDHAGAPGDGVERVQGFPGGQQHLPAVVGGADQPAGDFARPQGCTGGGIERVQPAWPAVAVLERDEHPAVGGQRPAHLVRDRHAGVEHAPPALAQRRSQALRADAGVGRVELLGGDIRRGGRSSHREPHDERHPGERETPQHGPGYTRERRESSLARVVGRQSFEYASVQPRETIPAII